MRRHRLRAKAVQVLALAALVAVGMLVAFVVSGSALPLQPFQTTTGTTTTATTTTGTTTTGTTTTAATAPANQSPPTITGQAQDGQTLTAQSGTWSGTSPIAYTYQWQRCDTTGAACVNIAGATGTTYVVTSADVGHTLRVVVTASNAAGTSSATSAATSVVAASGTTTTTTPSGPAGQIRLANGDISIPVTSVTPPDRLVIDRVSFSPNPLRSRSTIVTGRFRVTDVQHGYRVRGALVYALALPYGQFRAAPELETGTDGYAIMRLVPGRTLVQRGSVVVFLRARKAGDSLLSGVSIRRLVQMRVARG